MVVGVGRWVVKKRLTYLLVHTPSERNIKGIGSNQSEEAQASSRTPKWVMGTQILGTSSSAFPGHYLEAGLEGSS